MVEITRNKVFISYSRKDKDLFEEFKTMLAPVIKKGIVDVWDDTRIESGTKWREEIMEAIASAKVAVLLVSPDFLDSDFIAEHELPPLLDAAKNEGVTVFWILLSPCLYEKTEIATYQAAHDVRTPLNKLNKPERQAALKEISENLIRIVHEPDTHNNGKGGLGLNRLEGSTIGEIFGRGSAISSLYQYRADDNINVVGITAQAGVGKTALVCKWLDQLEKTTSFFAWTFSHKSSAEFFRTVFDRLGCGQPSGLDSTEPSKLAKRLLDKLPPKTILVLDGLEELQHLSDDPTCGEQRGEFSRHEPIYYLLNEALNHPKQHLIIATSRLRFPQLEGRFGYQPKPLDYLDAEDGARLLEYLEVNGNKEERKRASDENSGHCLSLVFLGKILFNRYGGEIKHRHQIYSVVDLKSTEPEALKKEVNHASRVMTYIRYYDKEVLNSEEKILLQMMALLHIAMPQYVKDALVYGGEGFNGRFDGASFAKTMRSLEQKNWDDVSAQLEKYDLIIPISPSIPRDRWDCHPLIREYFRKSLQDKDDGEKWLDAHRVLMECFRGRRDKPKVKDDFEAFYRAMHHAVHAEQFDEALKIYDDYIVQNRDLAVSSNKFGLAAADIAALESMFNHPKWPENTLSKGDLEFLYGRMAFCLTYLARLQDNEAIYYRKKMLKLFTADNDFEGVAEALEQLSALYVLRGDLNKAKTNAEEALRIIEQNNVGAGKQERARCRLGAALYLMGDLQKCGTEFQEAKNIREAYEKNKPWLCSDYGIYYRLYKLDVASTEKDYEDICKEADEMFFKGDEHESGMRGIDQLVQAIAISRMRRDEIDKIELFENAKRDLDDAYCLVYMPHYHLALADFHLRRDKPDDQEALNNIEEARQIATHHGMKLFQVDCDLTEVRVHILRKDIDMARGKLTKAENTIRTALESGYRLRSTDVELLEAELAFLKGDKREAKKRLMNAKKLILESGRNSLLEWCDKVECKLNQSCSEDVNSRIEVKGSNLDLTY